jgi:hypothetical protein
MTLAHRALLVAVLAAAVGCSNGNGLDSTRPGSRCGPDLRVCPDGTAVGRIGPDCEWQACPRSAVPTTDGTAPDGQTPPAVPTPPEGNQPPFAPPG